MLRLLANLGWFYLGVTIMRPLTQNSLRRGLMSRAVAVLLALGCLSAQAAESGVNPDARTSFSAAKPDDVRIFVTNALKPLFEQIQAPLQKAVGRPTFIVFGGTYQLPELLASKQRFDVAVLADPAISKAVAEGKMVPGSRSEIVKMPVGIAARGAFPRKNLNDPNELKELLLGARFITRADQGMSFAPVEKLFGLLGITEQVKGRDSITSSRPSNLRPDEYELLLTTASEMYLHPEMTVLGNVPEKYVGSIQLSAAIGLQGNSAIARSVIAFLQSKAIDPAIAADHLAR